MKPCLLRVSRLLLLPILLVTNIVGSPSGASHCSSGTSEMSNNSHGLNGSGSLSDGNYVVHLQTSTQQHTHLPPDTTTTLATGVAHTISLNAGTATNFRGFLFRLSGKNGEVVKTSMTIADSSAIFGKPLNICADNVAGITHDNNSDKTTIDVIIQYDEPIELLLEVTVVKANNPKGSNLWYHSSYDFNLEEDDTISSTMGGVPKSPTAGSMEPSSDPTNDTTGSPSEVPSSEPSLSLEPTIPPSAEPSSGPSTSMLPSISIEPSMIPSVSTIPTVEDQSQVPSSEPTQTSGSSRGRAVMMGFEPFALAGVFWVFIL